MKFPAAGHSDGTARPKQHQSNVGSVVFTEATATKRHSYWHWKEFTESQNGQGWKGPLEAEGVQQIPAEQKDHAEGSVAQGEMGCGKPAGQETARRPLDREGSNHRQG